MTVEVWSAIFSGLTLVVFIVTAVAAIVQLRHLRANTSLSGTVNLMQDWQKPQFHEWISYLHGEFPQKMKDPSYVERFRSGATVERLQHPELQIADYYEQCGTLLKHGLLDRDVFMDIACYMVADFWRRLEPLITIMRERRGPTLYENFEYLAVSGEMWQRDHPDGLYPKNVPRWDDWRAGRKIKR
jgi:hypothetical protein